MGGHWRRGRREGTGGGRTAGQRRREGGRTQAAAGRRLKTAAERNSSGEISGRARLNGISVGVGCGHGKVVGL